MSLAFPNFLGWSGQRSARWSPRSSPVGGGVPGPGHPGRHSPPAPRAPAPAAPALPTPTLQAKPPAPDPARAGGPSEPAPQDWSPRFCSRGGGETCGGGGGGPGEGQGAGSAPLPPRGSHSPAVQGRIFGRSSPATAQGLAGAAGDRDAPSKRTRGAKGGQRGLTEAQAGSGPGGGWPGRRLQIRQVRAGRCAGRRPRAPPACGPGGMLPPPRRQGVRSRDRVCPPGGGPRVP